MINLTLLLGWLQVMEVFQPEAIVVCGGADSLCGGNNMIHTNAVAIVPAGDGGVFSQC